MAREVGPNALLSVVAPVYNEVKVVEEFLVELLESIRDCDFPGDFEVIVVDDGSNDGSGEKLDELAAGHPGEVVIIHLARNFGHESAVCAGLEYCRGDAIILMDSDMQDDPAAIKPFIEKWLEGYDVVYATRSSRKEGFFNRFLFRSFYRIFRWMANIKLPLDAGNFALMDRRVVDRINKFSERNRYLPGLRAWIGFRQTGAPIARRRRHDAASRVGLRGKWTLAMNAIFSFSYVPIFVFRVIGFVTILLALATIAVVTALNIFTGALISDWASLLITIAFFGGINLIGISVIGEYVSRIYDEVKGRPKYVIDRITERKRQS